MHVKRIEAFPSHKVSDNLGIEISPATARKIKYYRPSTGFIRRQVSDIFARV